MLSNYYYSIDAFDLNGLDILDGGWAATIFSDILDGGSASIVSNDILDGNYNDWAVIELSYPEDPQRTFLGLIQPLSGGHSVQNGKSTEVSTHRLYTEDESIISSTRVRITGDDIVYEINFSQQGCGITGFDRHREILLEVINV